MKRSRAGPGAILVALLLATAGATARSCAPAAQKDAADWCRVNGPGTVCDPCDSSSYIVCPEDDENASPRVERCAPGTLWDTSGARCVSAGRPRAECAAGIDVIVPSSIAGAAEMNDVQTYASSEIDPKDTGEDGTPIDIDGPPRRPLSGGDEAFGVPALRDLLPPPLLGSAGPLGGLLGGLGGLLSAGPSGSAKASGGGPLRMTMIMGRMGGPDSPKGPDGKPAMVMQVIERTFPAGGAADNDSAPSQLQGHGAPLNPMEQQLAAAAEAAGVLKPLGAPFGALPPNPLAGLLAGLTGLLGGAAGDDKKAGSEDLEELERADHVLERLIDGEQTVSAAAVGEPAVELTGNAKEDADRISKRFVERLGPIARDAAFRSLLVNAEPEMRDKISARRAAPLPATRTVGATTAAKLAAGRVAAALAPVLASKSADAKELAAALQTAPMDSILVDNKPQLMPSPRLAHAVGSNAALREALQTAIEEIFYDEVVEADLGPDAAGLMFDFDQPAAPAAPRRPAPADEAIAGPPVPAPVAAAPAAPAAAPDVRHGRHERRHGGKRGVVAPAVPPVATKPTAETRGGAPGPAPPPAAPRAPAQPAVPPRGVHARRGRGHQQEPAAGGAGMVVMH